MKTHSVDASPAFSLIEVALALGIVAFALVAIIGLFPIALKSSQESQKETRAALIAQQIFSDLQSAPGTGTFLVRGGSLTNPGCLLPVDLRTNSTNYLLYDASGKGMEEMVLAEEIVPGISGAAQFVSGVTVSTNSGLAGLSRVEVQVESPAFAPQSNRSHYTFVTMMRQEE